MTDSNKNILCGIAGLFFGFCNLGFLMLHAFTNSAQNLVEQAIVVILLLWPICLILTGRRVAGILFTLGGLGIGSGLALSFFWQTLPRNGSLHITVTAQIAVLALLLLGSSVIMKKTATMTSK
ncbi:MAG: hypothetical protein K9N47_28560 [Prosthecobacter sp.]|uniref:hypothetical protein n=1 Tax=Prosthecobacter sp. TaxID=1965333 RepID=UPI00260D3EA3|nr:hypothetical protein [Prosthecobacter sp.]MCF7790104.1 hypothetical protein [Prosthecobacter sp.]